MFLFYFLKKNPILSHLVMGKVLHWGVSDHYKVSSEPIFFLKHPCVLMDHNISTTETFWGVFILLWHIEVFSCIKTFFLDFHQKKFSCNADIKIPYCKTLPLLTNQQNVDDKMARWSKIHFSCMLIKHITCTCSWKIGFLSF